MSEKRRMPADLLLMRERLRRLRGEAISMQVVEEEVLVFEADAIVEAPASLAEQPVPAGALYRPLSDVLLGSLGWSGKVDHAALQDAIRCFPHPAPDEAALSVALGPDDRAALSNVRRSFPQDAAETVVRAAELPSTIVRDQAGAGTAVFASYRQAALVCAWQYALCGAVAPDAERERDAAAVQLITFLRTRA